MREMIKISREMIGSEEVNSVNARELYEALDIKKDFSNWIKRQIDTLGLEENIDYLVFALKGENSKGGRSKIEYIITTDSAKHIAMASRTQKGKEVRRYFIEVERRYREEMVREVDIEEAIRGMMSKAREYDKIKREHEGLKSRVRLLLMDVMSGEEEKKEEEKGNEYYIKEYIDENLEVSLNNKIAKAVLYSHYVEWCRQKGMSALKDNMFYKLLRRYIAYEPLQSRVHNFDDGVRAVKFVVGVRIKSKEIKSVIARGKEITFKEYNLPYR